MTVRPALAVLAVMCLAAASCGHAAARQQTTRVTVFAASSLTGPFTELARHFAGKATFNFAASSTLERQIEEGGDADVFASADEIQMGKLVAHHDVVSPAVFATNTLEIAVPKGSTRVRSLADLSRPGLNVALCAAVVPCGHFADEVLAKAHVSVRSPSREEDVKAVLTKVGLGEADAGVVYTSDVATSPRVDGVAIPAADNVVARYPIATLTHARNAAAARAFVALVLSSAGRDVLRRYGFRA